MQYIGLDHIGKMDVTCLLHGALLSACKDIFDARFPLIQLYCVMYSSHCYYHKQYSTVNDFRVDGPLLLFVQPSLSQKQVVYSYRLQLLLNKNELIDHLPQRYMYHMFRLDQQLVHDKFVDVECYAD